MIETWKCNDCEYSDVDMKFYKVGKDIAVCPRCNSENIEVIGGYKI